MNDLIKAISQADELAIEELLTAVLARFAVLYPDWEVATFSVNKKEDKNEQLDSMIKILEGLKTN